MDVMDSEERIFMTGNVEIKIYNECVMDILTAVYI